MGTVRTFVIALGFACAWSASAAPVFSVGGTVTAPDRTATFSTLTINGTSLASYSEDMLSITVNDDLFTNFNAFAPGDTRTTGFHYGTGGNTDFVTIKGTDDATFTAMDFLLGDGFVGTALTNLRWATLLNGTITGSGLQNALVKGSVVGWTDVGGFDELRVAAGRDANLSFGNFQAIALDDVRAQMGIAQVPEPISIALVGLALAGLGFSRRKRAVN